MANTVYHDRGIIKWAPFDALVGYHSLLKELKYRLNKHELPILSDDKQEELNRKLQIAVFKNVEIQIHYFEDGYTKTVFGRIHRLDWIKRKIILEGRYVLSANQVLEIDFMNS